MSGGRFGLRIVKRWRAAAASTVVAFVMGQLLIALPQSGVRGEGERESVSAGLFVGISEFEPNSGLPVLKYAVNDAVAVAHMFVVRLGLIEPANALLALSGGPTSDAAKAQLAALKQRGAVVVDAGRKDLLDHLDTCRRRARGDAFLVMALSTHGFESDGDAYVMPFDGRRNRVKASGLPLSEVRRTLQEADASKRILIVDACRETVAEGEKGGASLPEEFKRELRDSKGFAALVSCGPGQLSYEDARLEQGVFAHYLIKSLDATGRCDPDGYVRLRDVADTAARETSRWVAEKKRATQRPWFEGEARALDIPLARDEEAKRRVENARNILSNAAARHPEILGSNECKTVERLLYCADYAGDERCRLLEIIERHGDVSQRDGIRDLVEKVNEFARLNPCPRHGVPPEEGGEGNAQRIAIAVSPVPPSELRRMGLSASDMVAFRALVAEFCEARGLRLSADRPDLTLEASLYRLDRGLDPVPMNEVIPGTSGCSTLGKISDTNRVDSTAQLFLGVTMSGSNREPRTATATVDAVGERYRLNKVRRSEIRYPEAEVLRKAAEWVADQAATLR